MKSAEAVRELEADGGRAMGVAVDVTDEASVAGMVATVVGAWGGVDILVNNAGMSFRKAPQDNTLEEWQQVIEVNLTGSLLCARECHGSMVERGGGKVINIGSMTSVFGNDLVASYSASKGGVVQLTKSLALAWAKDNIQVNAILPGWIETDLTAPLRTKREHRARYESISARIPQGRWGEPRDMAGAAVLLASGGSDYVTGASLAVDGGYTSC